MHFFLSIHMRYLLFNFFLLSTYSLWCGSLPKDHAILNYTSVYFEEEGMVPAHTYLLYLDTDSAAILSGNSKEQLAAVLPAFRITDLKWNTDYFWRIIALDKRQRKIQTGKLHHFSILKQTAAFIDSILIDVKTNVKDKHAGGFLCIDYTRCIYNRLGEAVWTLPFIKDCVDEHTQIRDLKVTPDNTLTFLTDKFPLEIDFNGAVLWKAPFPFVLNGDTVLYHHDFKKTSRGTYMVLGNKHIYRRVLGDYGKAAQSESDTRMIDSVLYKKAWMTVLLEFNAKGDLLWFWDANTYVTDADLNVRKGQSGFPDFSTHSNAFSESAGGDKIYVGFRDLSRIVKIDKQTKRVEISYGEAAPDSKEKTTARSLFKHQHDATVTNHNSLLVFNNNNPGITALNTPYTSSVIEINEDAPENSQALLWQFDIRFDGLSDGKAMTGGNITELPNTNLLVCAGTLNRIFEVTRNKEVVWDAFVLMKTKRAPRYRPFPQYRCSWTTQLADFHFIPRLLSSSKKRGQEIKINMEITNTGNTADAYVVTAFSSGNQVVYTQETHLAAANSAFELKFSLPANAGKEDQLRVEIKSKNSKEVKTLVLTDSKK